MQPTTFPTPGARQNPLASYMRQPKIYIKLPSQGNYWPAKSINMPENGEIPVYSMTAKDELIFKTPDALLNGQSIVDVIQSCLPNIKDAWQVPSIDLDMILIAIRLATYGETMSLKHKIPVIKEEVEYDVDLRNLLDQQSQNIWAEQVAIDENMVVYVRPLTYRHITQASMKSFETSRIMNMVNDDTIPDDRKIEMFQQSFAILTKVTVDMMCEGIYKIATPDTEVTDKKFIQEFVNNSDKVVFEKINEHLSEMKKLNDLKPLVCSTSEEQQAQGAPATYEIPINFNQSDFFA
jgi:hypothetical protein